MSWREFIPEFPWWLWVALATLFGLTAWWVVVQWHECRAMDFSVLYCIAHVA